MSISAYSMRGQRAGTQRSGDRRGGRRVRRGPTHTPAGTGGGGSESYGRLEPAGQTSLYGGKAGFQREASDVGTLFPTGPQVPKDQLIAAVAAGPSSTLKEKKA